LTGVPVPFTDSKAHVSNSTSIHHSGSKYARGNGGRIGRLLVAWNAATRIEMGTASFISLLRTASFEIAEDNGLLMAGKVGDGFVEKAFLVANLRHDCRRTVGRTIEVIAIDQRALSRRMCRTDKVGS
jgi:hypothetical protein